MIIGSINTIEDRLQLHSLLSKKKDLDKKIFELRSQRAEINNLITSLGGFADSKSNPFSWITRFSELSLNKNSFFLVLYQEFPNKTPDKLKSHIASICNVYGGRLNKVFSYQRHKEEGYIVYRLK